MAQAGLDKKARPESISPKVNAVGISGAVLTGVLLVAASFLGAIPASAFTALGVWGVPVGAAVATLVNYISGYAKADPAREPTVVRETAIAAPVDPEAEATVVIPEEDSEADEEGASIGVWVTSDADSETTGGSTVAEVDEFDQLAQRTGNTPKHRADG